MITTVLGQSSYTSEMNSMLFASLNEAKPTRRALLFKPLDHSLNNPFSVHYPNFL